MSASEKLERLEELIHEHDRIAATEVNGVYAEPLPPSLLVGAFKARMEVLPAALPEIIAVVKAAENPNALRSDLDRALIALDAKLGDVHQPGEAQ